MVVLSIFYTFGVHINLVIWGVKEGMWFFWGALRQGCVHLNKFCQIVSQWIPAFITKWQYREPYITNLSIPINTWNQLCHFFSF